MMKLANESKQEPSGLVKAFLVLHFIFIPLPLLTFLCGERKKEREKQNDKDERDPTNSRYLHVDSTPPTLLHGHISFDSYSVQVRKTRQSRRK